MGQRVVVLGAGFGGLELSTTLSEELGDAVEVTLIDKNDAFVFGFAKLDLMFGKATGESVRMPYAEIAKPGVRVLRETVTAIDPEARRVTTDAGVHEADVLVVALGADYDVDGDARPGRGRPRVLLRRRGRTAGRGHPRLLRRQRRDRRRRCALQVPAGAERVRPAARRGAEGAGGARRLPDLLRDPLRHPGAALAGDLGGAGSGVRGARRST